MRNILVVLAALSLSTHLNAQALKLLEPNKQWTVEYADQVILPPEIDQLHYEYEGDTIIGNITYQLFGNGAILREDTLERKVYSFNGDAECLLYDFSAAPGDTLALCEGIRIVVDSITQFISADGLLRKQFHVSSDDAINLEYYIEGVGTNLGFVEASEIIGPPSLELMCVKKDGVEIFGGRCDEVVAAAYPYRPDNALLIYPNPSTGRFAIEFSGPDIYVRIVDINGKTVLEREQKAEDTGMYFLNPGLYFILLFNKGGHSIGWKKLVVVE